MVERFGAELLRQSTDVLEALLDDLLRRCQLLALLRVGVGPEPLELQEHSGHRLADLVVQATCEALAFGLLCLQCVRTRLPALLGQSVEHRVEGPLERPNLVRKSMSLQGMTAVNAYDGTAAWQIQPFEGHKDPELMGEDDLKDLLLDADFDGLDSFLISYEMARPGARDADAAARRHFERALRLSGRQKAAPRSRAQLST